jgi:DNA-binding transcriptional MerR regulator
MLDVEALAQQIIFEENFVPDSYVVGEEVEDNLRPDLDKDLSIDEIIEVLRTYPDKQYRIGDVAEILDVKIHVIRYWESEFKSYLKTKKTGGGQRLYSFKDIEILFRIKKLLHLERYSIAGAKKKLKTNDLTKCTPASVSREILVVLKEELEELCSEIDSNLCKLHDSDHLP